MATNFAYSDIGTKLMLMGTEGKFQDFINIKSAPSPMSDPEKLEATELQSEVKQYVKGRADLPDVAFTYNYTKENYKKVQKACDGTDKELLIVYPDGSGYRIKGQLSTRVDDVSVGSVIEATLSAVLSECAWVENTTELTA